MNEFNLANWNQAMENKYSMAQYHGAFYPFAQKEMFGQLLRIGVCAEIFNPPMIRLTIGKFQSQWPICGGMSYQIPI